MFRTSSLICLSILFCGRTTAETPTKENEIFIKNTYSKPKTGYILLSLSSRPVVSVTIASKVV